MPALNQPNDITNEPPTPSRLFIDEKEKLVQDLHKILSYKEKGKQVQFLTQYKNVPNSRLGIEAVPRLR